MNTGALEIGPDEIGRVAETARHILARDSDDVSVTWSRLAAAGLVGLDIDSDLSAADRLRVRAAVVAEFAKAATDGPYPDAAIVAEPLAALAGLALPPGPVTAAVAHGRATVEQDRVRIDLLADRVVGDAAASAIVVAVREADMLLVVDPVTAVRTANGAPAAMARDSLHLTGDIPRRSAASLPGIAAQAMLRGALSRALQLAGAATQVERLTIRYAQEREQFGRPIGRFQVVQHALAELAVEVAAMAAAAERAVDVCARDGFDTSVARFAVAVAKAQCSASAGVVARIAHQVHGAIGTTQEHPLHRYTTRLWSWRDDYGDERFWQQELGATALEHDIWEVVTT